MQYSPKLKKAMEEIKEVLKKYDIAAFAVLHTPGHAEYLLRLTPSYSACNIDNATGRIQIKGRLEHYLGDRKQQEFKLSSTCNMLNMISVLAMQRGLALAEISKMADEKYNAEHTDGNQSSQQEQNN